MALFIIQKQKKKIHFQQQMEQAHMNKIKSNNNLTKTWFYQTSW